MSNLLRIVASKWQLPDTKCGAHPAKTYGMLIQKIGVLALTLREARKAIITLCAPRLAVNDLTAVRVQNLARDVGRVVRGKEDVAGRHFFGLPGALHRHVGAEAGDLLLREG